MCTLNWLNRRGDILCVLLTGQVGGVIFCGYS